MDIHSIAKLFSFPGGHYSMYHAGHLDPKTWHDIKQPNNSATPSFPMDMQPKPQNPVHPRALGHHTPVLSTNISYPSSRGRTIAEIANPATVNMAATTLPADR
jgi:hypothetical protein